MHVIIIGSGTAIPLNDRGSPCIAVLLEGKVLLLDIGPGSLRQLTRVGISHNQIDQVFLTHFHPDHTADLIHLLFATRNPGVLKGRRPFSITGPPGTLRLIAALQRAYPDWLTLPPDIMAVEELDMQIKGRRDYGDFTVIATPVNHTRQSLAYRIRDRRGKALVYSGDTGISREIVDLARGADMAILEASFPSGQECEGHLTPTQAGQIATLAGIPHLVLVHFYPECLAVDAAAQCRRTYSGELTLGEDLLLLRV
ncbi:MAG: ribonuclease Z [Deltaproteobacteria bacterium]|nr:ribonuclease Z [Deltaproteobacteria bacterium]